ncbi:acyltransferase [Candidatus Peribacteria bacterium]|nr:acyltransferase [Candidatus Peribacteria bacterium]
MQNKRAQGLPINQSHALTIMRSFAILFIVGYWHLFSYTDAFPEYTNWVTHQMITVVMGIFTFSSGYLLFPKAAHKSPLAFYRNRFIRIYPLFLLAVVCFYVLGLQSPERLIKAVFLTSTYALPLPMTLWYVVMLIQLYILAPFLARFCTTVPRFVLTVAVFIGLHLCLGFFGVPFSSRILLHFPAFTWGLLLRRRMQGASGRIHASLWTVLVVASIGSIAMAMDPIRVPSLRFISHVPLTAVAPTFLFLLFSQWRMSAIARVLAPVAYAMYTMYLFHRVLYQILITLYFPEGQLWQVCYLACICVPVIFVVSYGIQRTYDLLVHFWPYGMVGSGNVLRKRRTPLQPF